MTTLEKTKKKAYHHGSLRDVLLNAAEVELSEKGLEAFSLRGVAKRADVSHAAPAHHFPDAKSLLTALAARGYRRFVDAQEHRQRQAPPEPRAQLAAAGLGYIDFAISNPALFRLMFSSEKPDITDKTLAGVSTMAFDKLVKDIERIAKSDPYVDPIAMTDVMAAWAVVHGMADLLIAGRTGRFTFFETLNKAEQDSVLSDIILRASTVDPDNKCMTG